MFGLRFLVVLSVMGLASMINAMPVVFKRGGKHHDGLTPKGSPNCPKDDTPRLEHLVDLIDTISDSFCADPEQRIACHTAGVGDSHLVCVFVQYTTNVICGVEIKARMRDLFDAGYKQCGSVPIGYPENSSYGNNVGALIVDYQGSTKECDKTGFDGEPYGFCPGVKYQGPSEGSSVE